MSPRGRQRRHRVTVVNLLPKDVTPDQKKEAKRKLELAKMAAALTPDQVRQREQRKYRGGKFDGKSRRNRTRRARRNSAIREQE